MYSWVVKIRNTSEAVLGLGQYVSLGEYCDPQTDSSVILILFLLRHAVVLYQDVLGISVQCYRQCTQYSNKTWSQALTKSRDQNTFSMHLSGLHIQTES